MPVINGYTLLKRIRTSGAYRARFIPVIALSGDTNSRGGDTDEYSFTGLLNKMFTIEEFIRLINEICFHNIYNDTEINLASLISFTGDDPEEISDILKKFTQTTREDIEKLNQYLSEKKKEEIKQICHRLSSSLNLVTNKKSFWYMERIMKKSDTMSEQEWKEIVAEVSHILTILVLKIESSGFLK